jgi:hypothetical protein
MRRTPSSATEGPKAPLARNYTYGHVENDSEVPRIPLLEALSEKSAVVRSDQIAVKVGDVRVPAAIKAKLPKPKSGTLEVGSCYVDYLF